MKFTHLVLLNCSPWYIYAAGDIDALKYVGQYKDRVVGVAVAEGGLEVKVPTVQIRLTPEVQQQLEFKDVEKELDKAVEQTIPEDPIPKS